MGLSWQGRHETCLWDRVGARHNLGLAPRPVAMRFSDGVGLRLMLGSHDRRMIAMLASAFLAAATSATIVYRMRKAQKCAAAAEMAYESASAEVVALKSEVEELQAALSFALRRATEREQEIQHQQSFLAEDRAAFAEEREAIEAANDEQQAMNDARRKSLEQTRASRRASSSSGADAGPQEWQVINDLQERLDELRARRSEHEADEAVRSLTAQSPAIAVESCAGQSPAQAARAARREQAAADSERRRSKINLRRALSAKADSQLGASPRKPHGRRGRDSLAANDASSTAAAPAAAAGTVV